MGCSTAGLLALAACSDTAVTTKTDGGPEGGTTTDGATATTDIKVGVTLGLTGDLAGFAAGIQNSVAVAEAYINDNGGVTGKKVKFVIEDDKTSKGDGSQLLDNMKKFIERDKVVAILGPLGSGQVKTAHKAAKTGKIVQLSPSATSPDLGGIGAGNEDFAGTDRYFFRTCPPDDFQGVAVATFAYAGPSGGGADAGAGTSCRKLAIVHIDDAYGKTLKDVIKAEWAKKTGTSIVYEKEIPTEGANFTPGDATTVVAAVAAAGADCQAVVMYETVAGKYFAAVKASTALQAKPGFFSVGTDGIFTDGFIKESRSVPTDEKSTNYAAGVYGTNPDTNPETPDFKTFEGLYKTKFPQGATQDVPAFASNMFDAALLVSLAIQKAGGTTDPTKVRDMLIEVSKGKAAGAEKVRPADFASAMLKAKEGKDINYEGASGPVDFKADGSIAAGMIIWRVDQTAGAAPEFKTIQRITTAQLGQ